MQVQRQLCYSDSAVTKPFTTIEYTAVAHIERMLTVVAGHSDGRVVVFQRQQGLNLTSVISTPQCVINAHSGPVTVIRVLNVGSQYLIITGSGDRSLKVWALWTMDEKIPATGTVPSHLFKIHKANLVQELTPRHGGTISAVVTYENMFFSASTDATVKLWKLNHRVTKINYQCHQVLSTQRWLTGWVTDMALSSSSMVDVEVLYMATTAGDVLMYKRGDTVGGAVLFQPLFRFPHFCQLSITKMVHLSKEDIITTLSFDRKVKVYGHLIKAPIMTETCPADRRFTACHYIGETLLIGDTIGTLVAYQIKTGEQLYNKSLPQPEFASHHYRSLVADALGELDGRKALTKAIASSRRMRRLEEVEEPDGTATRHNKLKKAMRAHRVASGIYMSMPIIDIIGVGPTEVMIVRPHAIETYTINENPVRALDPASRQAYNVARPVTFLVVSECTELSDLRRPVKALSRVKMPRYFQSTPLKKNTGQFLPQIGGRRPGSNNTPTLVPVTKETNWKGGNRRKSKKARTGARARDEMSTFRRTLDRITGQDRTPPLPVIRTPSRLCVSQHAPRKKAVTPDAFMATLVGDLSRLQSTPKATRVLRSRSVMADRTQANAGRDGRRQSQLQGLADRLGAGNRFAGFSQGGVGLGLGRVGQGSDESDESDDYPSSRESLSDLSPPHSPTARSATLRTPPSPGSSLGGFSQQSMSQSDSESDGGYIIGDRRAAGAASVIQAGRQELDDRLAMHRYTLARRAGGELPGGALLTLPVADVPAPVSDDGMTEESFKQHRKGDTQRLYSVLTDGQLQSWRTDQLAPISEPAKTAPGIALAVAVHDRQLFVTGHEDGSVRLWDIVTADQKGADPKQHETVVSGLAVVSHKNRETIYSIAFTGSIFAWKVYTHTNGVRRLVAKDGYALTATPGVSQLTMAATPYRIYIGLSNGHILTLLLSTGDETTRPYSDDGICTILIDGAGGRASDVGAFLCDEAGRVGFGDLAAGTVQWMSQRHTGPIVAACSLGAGRFVSAVGRDLFVWSSEGGLVKTIRHDRDITAITSNPQTGELIVGTDEPAEIRTFSLD